MSKKLKVIPFDINNLYSRTYSTDGLYHQEPLEVISPVSWELNTNTNVLQEQGVLGNIITYNMPFQERTYRIDWVGSRAEINKVLNYFTKNSHRHFVLGNLSDHNVITPGMMFNSKGMLASVAEKYRFPGELYRDYLPRYHGNGYNVGSMGVKIAPNSSSTTDYSFVDTSDSAVGVLYLEKGQAYTMEYNKASYSSLTSSLGNLNHLLFRYTYYRLDNRYSDIDMVTIRMNVNESHYIAPADFDRMLTLELRVNNLVNSNSNVRGILNYIPPIIYKLGTSPILDDYEDIPSLLMPVDDYVYNVVSPTVAELSMNFKEITNVSE